MAIAGGIDLGGTKIEAQKFDGNWSLSEKRRLDTPKTYSALLEAVAMQVEWLREGRPDLPVGVAAAGMQNPTTGNWVAANLPAHGKPFTTDAGAGHITWLNDCRAFSLAEAIFGAGSDKGVMLGLLIGTGIGGAITVDGRLINDGAGQSGEFGHMPLSAEVVARHRLPVVRCGCGRNGCYETYGSGPGLERLAKQILGRDMAARDVSARRDDPEVAPVFHAWCEVNAALIHTLISVVDPATIVLGGGLSQMPGLVQAIRARLVDLAWDGFELPAIRLGTRGETAAALGAAYAAWRAADDV